MNILFVMKHRPNAGNIHAVVDYMRVGQRHGHSFALYGTEDPWVPDARFSTNVWAFDRLVYLFESELYRVQRLREVALLAKFPKRHRLILDMDGMYNPPLVLDDYDHNHTDEAESLRWIEFCDTLSDRIIKPTLAPSDNPRVSSLIIYGYDPALQLDPASAPPKQFDILHVGHNWWRWKEVAGELLPAFEQIRDQVGEIGFVGLWWDAPPPEGPKAGPDEALQSDPEAFRQFGLWWDAPRPEGRKAAPVEAFQSDPEAFRRLRIHTSTAVMYSDVIRTMSTARINIFTQRPILRHLKHLTLKYFEIFYADTIPLLMFDGDHAAAVYGPAGRELTLAGRVAEKLLDALRRPDHYRGLVEDVRHHLAAHHSYDRRVEELVAAMRE